MTINVQPGGKTGKTKKGGQSAEYKALERGMEIGRLSAQSKQKSNTSINKLIKSLQPTRKSSKGLSVGKRQNYKDTTMSQFSLMVKNPFAATALGVRFPDPWCFPTSTYKMMEEVILSTSGAQSQGLVFYPHPFISFCDTNVARGVASMVSSTAGYNNISNNPSLYGLSTPSICDVLFNNFRTVGSGVKMSMICPEAVRTGRIFCAPVPLSRMPGWNALNVASMAAGLSAYQALGGGSNFITGNFGAGIMNWPDAFEITANQMAETDIILRFKPHNDNVTTFKNSNGSTGFNSTQTDADQVLITTSTGVIGSSDNWETTDMTGWNGWVVWIEGAPANQSYIQLKQIVHLEAQPIIAPPTVGTGTAPVPTDREPGAKVRGAFNRVYDVLSTIPLETYETIAMNVNNIYQRASGGVPRLTNY